MRTRRHVDRLDPVGSESTEALPALILSASSNPREQGRASDDRLVSYPAVYGRDSRGLPRRPSPPAADSAHRLSPTLDASTEHRFRHPRCTGRVGGSWRVLFELLLLPL